MSGLGPDGRIESFVLEFLHGQNDTLTFAVPERRPGDADGSDNIALTMRRAPKTTHDST
jgi:hypothetical protein